MCPEVLQLPDQAMLRGRRGSDATAARVLERVELQLMPTCNPDGFANHERSNGRVQPRCLTA